MTLKSLIIAFLALHQLAESVPQDIMCSTMSALRHDVYYSYNAYSSICAGDRQCFPVYALFTNHMTKRIREIEDRFSCLDMKGEDVDMSCNELYELSEAPSDLKDWVQRETHQQLLETLMKMVKHRLIPLLEAMGC